MNTFALLAVVLLATVAANASLLDGALGRKVAAEEDARDIGALGHILVDIGTLRTFGLIGEDIKHVDELVETSCRTQERCDKKKLVCSKKCTGSVRGLEHSAERCTLVCEKCVPNC